MGEDPAFWTDNVRAQTLLKEKAQLETVVGQTDRVQRSLDDAQALHELAEEAGDDAARAEAVQAVDGAEREVAALEFQRMLSGPHDAAGAIVEVKSGAGGVEAMDWAAMLYRMYSRFCERKGWEVEPADGRTWSRA